MTDYSISPDPGSVTVERIVPGLTREWLCDGRVVVYRLADEQRATIDMWIDAFRVDLLNWPADRPILIIHDFSSRDTDATPYARQRAHELIWMRPELKGKAAIILPATVAALMIKAFVAIAQGKETPRAQQAFTSRVKA